MLAAVGDDSNHCTACFDGKYPINIDDSQKKEYQNQKMLFDEYGIEEHS
jgi:glutamine phosphoribosylpyrophosphate amidotransferase